MLLIAVAFYLLYKAVTTRKHLRHHPHSNGNNVERGLFGHKIIDTNKGWLFFTSFVALTALGSHFLAENSFHVYDVTPVDPFTHGFSGMAVTAIILNLYLTRKRQFYYVVSIGTSWIAFIL